MERALVYEDLCKQPPIASFIDQSQCIFPWTQTSCPKAIRRHTTKSIPTHVTCMDVKREREFLLRHLPKFSAKKKEGKKIGQLNLKSPKLAKRKRERERERGRREGQRAFKKLGWDINSSN
jgi:hypothetical protein